MYYSPNSSKLPKLPSKSIELGRNPLKDDVEEYHNPQWWKMNTAYLPFLPITPQFGQLPFHELYNNILETGPQRKQQIRMDSNDVLNWKQLEATLAQIFKSFQSTYCIPEMSLIVPTLLACQEAFEYQSQFLSVEKHCRKWFAMSMALVSLGIAIVQISDGDSEDTLIPKWYNTFVQHTDEAVLAGIRQQLGQFTPWYPRAGVFVDLCSSEEQPTVDFFVQLNIPVWYPWGVAEEAEAHRNPSYWTKYTPPAHKLQQARTFLSATPRMAPLPKEHEGDDVQPWTNFFANRARRVIGPMPRKKPNMKVYHWEKDDNGKWQRVAVLKQLRSETLDEYGRNQKVFDERSNEWDCCTDMGELEVDERQALYNEEYVENIATCSSPNQIAGVQEDETPVINLESSQTGSSFINNDCEGQTLHDLIRSPASLHFQIENYASSRILDDKASFLPEQQSPAGILTLFFGFVEPPPVVRLDLPKPSEQQIKDLTLGIGCSNIDLI